MLETYTFRIDSVDVPNLTMEEAIDACRKKCYNQNRSVTLKVQVGRKYMMLGTYNPLPLPEKASLKEATMEQGDKYACLLDIVPPKYYHFHD